MTLSKNILFAVCGVIVLPVSILLVKVVLFPTNAANAAVDGANTVINRTLNGDNAIANYEYFFDAKAAYDARVAQIKSHTDLLKKEENSQEKSRLNIELSAMRQSCREVATKYNANSEKANRSLFKSKGLPESLEMSLCEV